MKYACKHGHIIPSTETVKTREVSLDQKELPGEIFSNSWMNNLFVNNRLWIKKKKKKE